MTRIKTTLWVLLAGLTALWLLADPVYRTHPAFGQLQNSFINYTGIIAMGVMAVSLLLALRSVAVEPYVGGLDKSYRLHKWLGVAGLVAIVAHWLWISAPSWLMSLGLMERPKSRAPRPPSPAWTRALSGPARGIGSWSFYIAVALLILALVKWFPYRRFLQTHKLLAVVYLALVFHSIVLLKTAYWTQPVAYVIALLMAAGTAAAIYILLKRVGRTRQAVGEIEKVTHHRDGQIVAVDVCLKDRWAGHEAGQFAFVGFGDEAEPHPFTISSSWRDDGNLTFVIKTLGDYTSTLPATLKPGTLVRVEGPYGRFNFQGPHQRQIWISGGIGITPFVSRMQQLAAHPDGKIIDLFHVTSSPDVRINDQLWRLVAASKVHFHVWVSSEHGRMRAEHICRALPDWKQSDIWFCGPVEFGKSLRDDFVEAGLQPNAFHQELFHLR